MNFEYLENQSSWGHHARVSLERFSMQRSETDWKGRFQALPLEFSTGPISFVAHDVLQAKKAIAVADAIRLAGNCSVRINWGQCNIRPAAIIRRNT